MQEPLHDYHTSISIGGRPICSQQFANNVDLMSGSNGELQELTNSLMDRAMAYGMEVGTEKSKIMTKSMNNIGAAISMNGQKLEEVTSFMYLYLGATMWKDGTCSAEVCIRRTSAMAAMARLNRVWQCNTISFASKYKLYKSPVTSILLYAVKNGPCLLTEKKRIQAFKIKYMRKLLLFSTLGTRPTSGCGARSTSLGVPRKLLWQLSRDGNLHGWGMSLATTASQRPFFKACWKVDDTMVGRGSAG